MKCASKKEAGDSRRSMRKTGGGLDDDTCPISPNAERIVAIAGGRRWCRDLITSTNLVLVPS